MARTFVFEDTRKCDYRYIRDGLLRRGWGQLTLPRVQPRVGSTSKLDVGTCWVRHRGAMGISVAGHKNTTYPDLIWTLSCGHSPGLEDLGPEQQANFFSASECLTTKAGLCRTLQGNGCWGSEGDEGGIPPQCFFPRCFDLSDSSQLDEFKNNFRLTAAAAVLKVFCRVLTDSHHRSFLKSPADKRTRLVVGKAGVRCPTPPQHCGHKGDFGATDCLGDIHSWMLGLAVQACRRRLLEVSGWHEDFHTGNTEEVLSDTDEAKSLTDREWRSLMLYSYVLRRATNDQDHKRFTQNTCDRREFKGRAERNRDCDFGGAGLRGLRNFGDTPSSNARNPEIKRARRPSSAPAGRALNDSLSKRRKRVSNQQWPAKGTTLEAECGGGHHSTAPGNWGATETEDLREGLLNIWGPSKLNYLSCCGFPYAFAREREWQSEKSSRKTMSKLALEAGQLCAVLEKKCPQWTMDGEHNLWMLKPAGASKGQGVRVAWTLDQIICAQKTMGGRVVQKYVEVPFLLRRHSLQPSLPSTLCLERGVRQRRGSELRRRDAHAHGDRLSGIQLFAKVRRRERGELDCSDTSRVSETWNTKSSDRVGVVAVESPPSKGVTNSLPRSQRFRLEDRAPWCNGGTTEHVDIYSVSSAGARKFDIRVWVLVTGWDPLEAFVFDECYVRVCPNDFTLAESKFDDPQVHLTNISARRLDHRTLEARHSSRQHRDRRQRLPGSARPVCASAPRRVHFNESDARKSRDKDARAYCREEWDAREVRGKGFVASQAELIQRLGEMDEVLGEGETMESRHEEARARGERVWKGKVWPSIEGIARSTLLAAKSHIRPRAKSFQLFGFDLLLDRQLNPWLLEVNLSPALSHSSRSQSTMIQSMCEGLLRLTVDRTFPAPQSSALKLDLRDGNPCSDTFEGIDSSSTRSCRENENVRSRRFGAWRPITSLFRPISKNEAIDATSCSRSRASKALPNSSAQVFSLRGKHLTRRDLERAERGVREATAVKLLTVWWRSTAQKRREKHSRNLRAIAEIGEWVIKVVAGRRRRALRGAYEQSARVIQGRWRRAKEVKTIVARVTACVVVQRTWRDRRMKRRWDSRQAIRRKLASGLQRWARSTLSRRRKGARKTIVRVVVATIARQNSKRHAAAVIRRGLATACNRRRQSRLVLQRFARMPCLLQLRLADLALVRIARVHNGAAKTIARALRRAAALASTPRATVVRNTLQRWCKSVLQRWEQRYVSTVKIQQAWRRARQGRIWDEKKVRCVANLRFEQDSSLAAAGEKQMKVAPTSFPATASLAINRVPFLDISGSLDACCLHFRRDATAPARHSPAASLCSPPVCRTAEDTTQCFAFPVQGQSGSSVTSVDHLLSPATTMREDRTDPNPCLAGDDAPCCGSNVLGAGRQTFFKGQGEIVTTARRPQPFQGSIPFVATKKQGGKLETSGRARDYLDLEDVLPDFFTSTQKATLTDGKHRDGFAATNEHKHSNGVPNRTNRVNRPQEVGRGRPAPNICRRDVRRLYPLAGGTHAADTRAQKNESRRAETQAKEEHRETGVLPTDRCRQKHQIDFTLSFDCRPHTFKFGSYSALAEVAPASRKNGKTIEKASGSTGANHHPREGLRASAGTNAAKNGRVSGAKSSSTFEKRRRSISNRCRTDIGGVLEMLAYMEI